MRASANAFFSEGTSISLAKYHYANESHRAMQTHRNMVKGPLERLCRPSTTHSLGLPLSPFIFSLSEAFLTLIR